MRCAMVLAVEEAPSTSLASASPPSLVAFLPAPPCLTKLVTTMPLLLLRDTSEDVPHDEEPLSRCEAVSDARESKAQATTETATTIE